MDNQEFSRLLFEENLLLESNWTCVAYHGCYFQWGKWIDTLESSQIIQWIISFRISSLLIPALCMIFFWNSMINSLHLRESMLLFVASIFAFCKVSQTYYGFLLISNFLQVWLLWVSLSLFLFFFITTHMEIVSSL